MEWGINNFEKIKTMNQKTRTNHEIDYKIYGEELQFVEIELDPGETAIAESGAMMMMDNGIEMQTIFGDGSASTRLVGDLADFMPSFANSRVFASR